MNSTSRTGFVKSAEQIRRIEQTLSRQHYWGARRAHVQFSTTMDFVKAVLPPGLEAVEAVVTVTVSSYHSNCVGDFDGATLSIPARHGELEAAYAIAMYMSTDHAITFGREVLGEPKKQANFQIEYADSLFHARVRRLDTCLIDLALELGDDRGPDVIKTAAFNVKAQPAANGHGLEQDAVLVLAEVENHIQRRFPAVGRLLLTGTPHDPLDSIPCLDIVGAGCIEGDLFLSADSIATIPAADFLPYAYGRMDDWSAFNT